VVVVARFDREAAAVAAERVRQSIFSKGAAEHDAGGATTNGLLSQLPAELQRAIFERLDAPALLALAQTSCTLYATITSLPTLYAALLSRLHYEPGTVAVQFFIFICLLFIYYNDYNGVGTYLYCFCVDIHWTM
jgi:hypothetical protein